jgi:predicted acyl esterase
MVALNALPPVLAVAGPEWRERWRARVEGLEPWLLRWLEEQDDGPYWRQGSLRPTYERIACPTMLVAGWADGYRNATFRMLERLRTPTRLLFGPWSHTATDRSLPGPRIDLVAEMVRWWDRWLRGKPNGVDEAPPVTVFVRQATRPAPDLGEHAGSWRDEPVWPPERATTRTLLLAGAAPGSGGVDRLAVRGDVGSAAWISCAGHLPFGQPDDQRSDDAWWLVYDWELDEELEILGHPLLRSGSGPRPRWRSCRPSCATWSRTGPRPWWRAGSSTSPSAGRGPTRSRCGRGSWRRSNWRRTRPRGCSRPGTGCGCRWPGRTGRTWSRRRRR